MTADEPGPGAAAARRADTRDPHRSRERALKILFQADVRGQRPVEALARIDADPAATAMLDDLDLEDLGDENGAAARRAQARADAAAGTTLGPAGTSPALDRFTRSLVEGVDAHLDDLDDLVNRYARGWTVKRMPVIDRNVLRLALHELLHEDTAPPIVIDEALEFAKALSTDRSHRFINGVLEAIRREVVAPRRDDGAPA